MDNLVLSTLLKYMIVRDVLPKTQPLKHIKTFEDFCRICVFPFLVFENNEETVSENFTNNSSCPYDELTDPDYTTSAKQTNNTVKMIELWGRAPGLLHGQKAATMFLDSKKEVNVTLLHIEDNNLRMILTSRDESGVGSALSLDLEFEPSVFERDFDYFAHEDFKRGTTHTPR